MLLHLFLLHQIFANMDEITIEPVLPQSRPLENIYEHEHEHSPRGSEVCDKSAPKLPHTEIPGGGTTCGEVTEAPPRRSKLQLAVIMTLLYVSLYYSKKTFELGRSSWLTYCH